MLAQRLSLSLPTIKNVSPEGFDNLYSLDFDGVDDYVKWGDADVFSINDSGANRGFSISAWIKTTGSQDEIISKIDGSNNEYKFEVGRNGKLEFVVLVIMMEVWHKE